MNLVDAGVLFSRKNEGFTAEGNSGGCTTVENCYNRDRSCSAEFPRLIQVMLASRVT